MADKKIIDNEGASKSQHPSTLVVPKSKAEQGGNYTPGTRTHATPAKTK